MINIKKCLVIHGGTAVSKAGTDRTVTRKSMPGPRKLVLPILVNNGTTCIHSHAIQPPDHIATSQADVQAVQTFAVMGAAGVIEQQIHRDPALLYAPSCSLPHMHVHMYVSMTLLTHCLPQQLLDPASHHHRHGLDRYLAPLSLDSPAINAETAAVAENPPTALSSSHAEPPYEQHANQQSRVRKEKRVLPRSGQGGQVSGRPREQGQATGQPTHGSGSNGRHDGHDEGQRGDDGTAVINHGMDQRFLQRLCHQ